MSDVPVQSSFRDALIGRWQIPLLGVALLALITGLLNLRPAQVAPAFDRQVADLDALLDVGLFDAAAERGMVLIGDKSLTPEERAGVHLRIARASHGRGVGMDTPSDAIANDVIQHYQLAVPDLGQLSAAGQVELGDAYQWLGEPHEAVAYYDRAIALGPARIVDVLRKKFAAQSAIRPPMPVEQSALLDRIIDAAAEAAPDAAADLMWAVEEKLKTHFGENQTQAARQLIERVKPLLVDPAHSCELEYGEALAWYHAGDYADSERQLTVLQQRSVDDSDLKARINWLLGRTVLADGRPESAMLWFQRVVENYPGGDWHAPSLLGIAEAQVALMRYADAVGSYRAALEAPSPRNPETFDRSVIRASLTAQVQLLFDRGAFAPALGLHELAERLLPDDDAMRATYALQRGKLHKALARRIQAQDQAPAKTENAPIHESSVYEHWEQAGAAYYQFAQLRTSEPDISADAMLEAASLFDRAGNAKRTTATLLQFIRMWSGHPRVPEAVYSLGQRYQADAQYDQAIDAYARCIEQYPRTPAAFHSYLPLAESLLAKGGDNVTRAEATLLAVVDSADPESLFTPDAEEFKNALFLLGDIYSKQGRFEDAIARLEEATQRYPDDDRLMRTQFMLADAYRRSAVALRNEINDGGQFREQMYQDFLERMRRASDLFGSVGDSLRRSTDDWSRSQRMYYELAVLYRGDCQFDLQQFGKALRIYEEAAWVFHDSVRALSAYVQIIRCHAYLGQRAQGRAALARAQQIARKIPGDQFAEGGVGLSKTEWESYLAWIVESELF